MLNAITAITDDVKKIPLGVKLIVFVIFLRMIGWGFVDPFFSIFIQEFSNSYTVIGSLEALLGVVSLITIIPLMRLTDRVKDSRIIEDGQILYFFAIVCYMLAGFFRSIPLLIAGLVLNGIGQPLVVVGSESYIRKHDGVSGSSKTFGYYTALGYFGWILGMIMAAFLIKYYNFNNMFLFILPSIILSFFILPKIKENGITSIIMGVRKYFRHAQDLKNIFADVKSLNPKMVFIMIIALFDGIIVMFSYVFIPLFAVSIHLTLDKIALLMAAMYLPFVFSFFFSEFTDKIKKMKVIAIGLFISAASFVLLSFMVHQLWIVVLAAMISLSLAIIRPAYNGIITSMTPRRMMGEITGLNNFVIRIGYIIGPIFTGLVADHFGIKIAFLAIAVLSFALGIATLFVKGYDYLTA
jgi:MFS family permease